MQETGPSSPSDASEQQQQQQAADTGRSSSSGSSGGDNPAISGADKGLQVSREVIEMLRNKVFGESDVIWQLLLSLGLLAGLWTCEQPAISDLT